MSLKPPKRNPLHITDIFHVVLDCLAEPFPNYDSFTLSGLGQIRMPQKQGQRAIAALAQTCRMLSEPSLNCLWHKLNSLRPLLRLLFPADVVDAGSKEDGLAS
ncbi:hypothetical protein OG21DRAFT_1517060 [Imleria badia]|nr:hypothetical protein OG21DRAFT_1517060 [Imleria badia]